MIADSTMMPARARGESRQVAIASARTSGGPTLCVGGAEPRAERR